MANWIEIKRQARQWHEMLFLKAGAGASGLALLDAATDITGIQRYPLPSGDTLLMGAEAIFDPAANVILFNRDVDPRMAVFYQMHEFAHHRLHNGTWSCNSETLNPEESEEEAPVGTTRVETYNARERAEREANIFAREALLPSDKLRSWFIDEGVTSSQIATRIGVTEGMVQHQLSFALLVSDLITMAEEEVATKEESSLDDSQKIVAEWEGSPMLVEAGPGTGKTRTLVGRIQYLLTRKVHPSSILALTFSNKAAEEMLSRVTDTNPEAAVQIWMGTFHAFGLELLRKYGFKIGINPDFRLIDPIDAMFLLEEKLQSLNLLHYRNLYEPTQYLPDILAAISRAKDELVAPDLYMELAKRMISSAGDDEKKRVAGEKAAEVAHVYKIYQQHLEDESIIDFGDLIFRPIVLLRGNPDVKKDLHQKYPHVLVDEYQDVNRASGMLLKEIAQSGKNLWVVGDRRQSIYRFRGASPINMRKFAEDFPGASIRPLEVNYRSRPAVIKAFASLAPKMKACSGQVYTPWKPHRGSASGTVRMEIGEDLEAEAAGMAKTIKDRRSDGCNYRDQAILCRSHTTMARIGARLEEAGVPILYLGDLFEREEVRDLLALISLACKGNGHDLIRVAGFAEYQTSLDDVVALITYAQKDNIPFPRALEAVQDVPEITAEGKRRMALLASHLKGICYGSTAWRMLAIYLFDRSSYLKSLLLDTSLAARQKRLAIYQFLEFVHGKQAKFSAKGSDSKGSLLEYVRKLEIHGEERQLRQVPEWASGLDAVRLLTVHASKGLEFDSVFIPYLGKGYFPASNRWQSCPPPDGMLDPEITEGGHIEEEECLFFVALSRAREFLCLSRADRYGEQNRNPSDFLGLIREALPNSFDGSPTWRSGPSASAAIQRAYALPNGNRLFDVRHLETYINCPRKYYYECVLGIIGKREDTAYVQFHTCTYRVLRWISLEQSAGNSVDVADAETKLAEVWSESGPCGHAYEGFYRENAKTMVSLAITHLARVGSPCPLPTWKVQLKTGCVQVIPDFFVEDAKSFPIVIRFRTGRPTSGEADKDIYAIYKTAVENASSGKGKVKIYYLSTGETEEVNMTGKKLTTRLNRYEKAMTDITTGLFPPKVDEWLCPRCPHYFICPAGETR